jgi:type IV secretion system protein VirB4
VGRHIVQSAAVEEKECRVKSKAELVKAAAAQIPAADHVPLSSHIRDNVIKLKRTGDYIATWRLEGIAFETADVNDLAAYKEGLCSFLRSLGGGNFAIWTHKVRRVVRERLQGRYTNAFAYELNERYYKSFDKVRQMATELYLTVVYRPTPSRSARLFKKLAVRSIEEIKAKQAEDLDVMDDIAKQLEAGLAKYGPERLSTFTKGNVVCSEMLALFGFLVNGVWEDVPLRRAELAEYLPTSRLHFGDRNGMLEIWHPSGKRFVGFLDFQEYPKLSEPGMNNGILYGNYEYIETQSFAIKNKREARAALERQLGHLTASEDASPNEIDDMHQAIDDLQDGTIEIGEYHFTLAIFGESLEDVAKNVSVARAKLQDGPGFKMAVVDAIPECAWFAQLPGNWSMRPREASITSRNFASLSPFHNFTRGKRVGNPWGEALALLKTPSGQPYYLNFHASPDGKDSTDEKYPGNTFICGSTGVGKTALVMSLLAFSLKYPGLRAVFFDKDRGAEIGIRAMGGKYYALERGKRTGFNPFQFEPTEDNLMFCEKLVAQLVKPRDPNAMALSSREEADISRAVRTVMSDHVSAGVRCLSAVSQNLQVTGDNSLRSRLRKWVGDGPLAWVFDNPQDTQNFAGSNLFGYDYTEFLDDPEVRTPIMAYLLHITERLIDGRPFIYLMDEFWKPLQDEMFSDFALNKQKTIRKQSGLGVFLTQSPSDVLVHRIGKTMVEQSVTQIFLPNPKADHDDYVNGFKVTEAEYRIIRALPEASRKFLVKQGHRAAVVMFDLGGMNDILEVISGTTDNIELLDSIRERLGDEPRVWLPEFRKATAARRAQMRLTEAR